MGLKSRILPAPLAKVTANGFAEYAVRLSVVTLIGKKLAPAGTVTVKAMALAEVTVALTAPK
jgi:hypothetical protein